MWEKDLALMEDIHSCRDQMREDSVGGRAVCAIESFGAVEQPISAAALQLAADYPAPMRLDEKIFPELVCISAEHLLPRFKQALTAAFPDDDPRFHKLYGPVKLPDRVSVKIQEYRDEGKAQWPFARKVRIAPWRVCVRVLERPPRGLDRWATFYGRASSVRTATQY